MFNILVLIVGIALLAVYSGIAYHTYNVLNGLYFLRRNGVKVGMNKRVFLLLTYFVGFNMFFLYSLLQTFT